MHCRCCIGVADYLHTSPLVVAPRLQHITYQSASSRIQDAVYTVGKNWHSNCQSSSLNILSTLCMHCRYCISIADYGRLLWQTMADYGRLLWQDVRTAQHPHPTVALPHVQKRNFIPTLSLSKWLVISSAQKQYGSMRNVPLHSMCLKLMARHCHRQ
jgi:hypothetical protein